MYIRKNEKIKNRSLNDFRWFGDTSYQISQLLSQPPIHGHK